jgi:hypothetical protein
MLARIEHMALATLAMALLGGCASQSGGLTPPSSTLADTGTIQPAPGPAAQTVSQLPPPAAGGSYQMTAADLDLTCKQLTGRTAVRIVQIRDYATRMKTTALSRTIQGATTTMLGGSMEGTDPEGRYAKDRAMLVAYNNRLIEKKCPSFDLDAELDPAAKEPPRVRMPDKS